MPVNLLNRRLIFVTGKGGVGKSTVSLALGLAAARLGKRTIVAELSGGDELQRAFGKPGGLTFEEVRLAHDLFTLSVDPQAAMEEYLLVKVPSPFASMLGQSKLFSAFAMATPGMRELLSIGKVWELAQPDRRTREADPYDLVIVDAPASGHSAGLLRTPRTFSQLAKVGPIARQGEVIARTIADRSFTAIVAVATPEEMPVNETLELSRQLTSEGLALDLVVINASFPERFAAADEAPLRAAAAASDGTQPLSAALGAALSERAHAEHQREQQDRLQGEFAGRLLSLPLLFDPELGPDQLEQLASRLLTGGLE